MLPFQQLDHIKDIMREVARIVRTDLIVNSPHMQEVQLMSFGSVARAVARNDVTLAAKLIDENPVASKFIQIDMNAD